MDLVTLAVVIASIAPIVKRLYDYYQERRREEAQEIKIAGIVASLEQPHSDASSGALGFTDFFAKTLRAATERERLTMLRAEASAARFSFLGTVLMVLSVLAPLLSWGVYTSLEPLTSTSIQYLKQLRADTGFIPSGDAIAVGRDWHILLAGLSLGFLFVAAARGILRQESQQRMNFLALAKRVAYYENLAWAIQVYDRLRMETGLVREASEGILRELIKPPTETSLGAKTPEDTPLLQSEQLDTIISMLRGVTLKEKV